MSSPIKGNKPLRMFASFMLIILIAGHLTDAINLMEMSVFWIMLVMILNALQASFTGFCPMFKNKKGECLCSATPDKACDSAENNGKKNCC